MVPFSPTSPPQPTAGPAKTARPTVTAAIESKTRFIDTLLELGRSPDRSRFSPVRASWTTGRQLRFPGCAINRATKRTKVRLAQRLGATRAAPVRGAPPSWLRAYEHPCG